MENKKVPSMVPKPKIHQRRAHFNDRILWVPREIAEQRLEICKNCVSLDQWQCELNGFFMPQTTALKTQQCPVGKWDSWYDFSNKKDTE